MGGLRARSQGGRRPLVERFQSCGAEGQGRKNWRQIQHVKNRRASDALSLRKSKSSGCARKNKTIKCFFFFFCLLTYGLTQLLNYSIKKRASGSWESRKTAPYIGRIQKYLFIFYLYIRIPLYILFLQGMAGCFFVWQFLRWVTHRHPMGDGAFFY